MKGGRVTPPLIPMRTVDLTSSDKTICIEIGDPKLLTDLELGEEVSITLKGKISTLKAPYETEDWEAEVKPGKKRPMKTNPGRVEVLLATEPEIEAIKGLRNMLASGDY